MRKKLFAILMSAMMMVTFMPAMAFAAGTVDAKDVVWSDNYTKCTIKGVPVTVTTSFDISGDAWTGQMVASVNGGGIPDYTSGDAASVKYYDLSMAQPSTISGNPAVDLSGVLAITAGALNTYFATGDATTTYNLKFTKPVSMSKLAGYASGDATKEVLTAAVSTTAYDETKPYVAQTLELTSAITYDKNTKYANAIPKRTLTVLAGTPAATDAYWTLDGKKYTDADTDFEVAYDGNAHVWKLSEVPGFTFKYEVYDSANNKWDVVDGLKVTDVATKKDFKVTWTDATHPTAQAFGVGFVDAGSFKATQTTVGVGFYTNTDSLYKDAEYDAASYIDVVTANKALQKNIDENPALVMDAFNAFYKITNKTGKHDASVKYEIEAKTVADGDFTAAEEKELKAKFKTFFGNIDLKVANGAVGETLKNTLTISFDKFGLNDVTTINQTKTYKNKTGKLAKTRTFMCKGDFADYGKLSYYKTSGNAKITVAKDGKVTVKKGLKKGTYTVKVKVKAPNASAVKTLKVIVKK